MTVVLLAVLLALAITWRRGKSVSRIVWSLMAIVTLAVGLGPVPGALADRLQRDYTRDESPTWNAHNRIVVLGLGTERVAGTQSLEPTALSFSRIAKGAELYRSCKAVTGDCKVLVSGGDSRGKGASEAAVYAAVLERLGVSPADLLREQQSRNTWENAKFSATILRQEPYDRVVLVTSGVHMKRSLLYFAHFGIEAVPGRSDYLAPLPAGYASMSYNFLLTDVALHEFVGMAQLRLYNAMGWNEPVVIPNKPQT